MRRNQERESFQYCAETCPAVESVIDAARGEIEELVPAILHKQLGEIMSALFNVVQSAGANRLRDALCEALSDKSNVEDERDDLKKEVSDLQTEISEMDSTISSLERELDRAGVEA